MSVQIPKNSDFLNIFTSFNFLSNQLSQQMPEISKIFATKIDLIKKMMLISEFISNQICIANNWNFIDLEFDILGKKKPAIREMLKIQEF